MAVLNIRESWLSEMDGILSKSILIDMLAQEPSVTRNMRIGGHEILQGKEKKEKDRKRKNECRGKNKANITLGCEQKSERHYVVIMYYLITFDCVFRFQRFS